MRKLQIWQNDKNQLKTIFNFGKGSLMSNDEIETKGRTNKGL